MRILNSILRSNALLRSALERSWGFLRRSSIRASLQQQRNKRAILVKVILANLKAHKFLTKFSIKNWLDLSRRQFDFYFQKVCFLVSCDSKISMGIKDSFPLVPNDCESFARRTFSTPKIRTFTTPKFGHFPPQKKNICQEDNCHPHFFSSFFGGLFLAFLT